MDIKRFACFVIATNDRPGELARFAKQMAEHEINLAGVWAFGLGRGSAEIVAIPRDPQAFKDAMKTTRWPVREGTCFHLTGADRAGALAETLDRIAQEGVNLQAVDGMGLGDRYSAFIWCDEKDVETIRKILKGW